MIKVLIKVSPNQLSPVLYYYCKNDVEVRELVNRPDVWFWQKAVDLEYGWNKGGAWDVETDDEPETGLDEGERL